MDIRPDIAALLRQDFSYFDISPVSGFLDVENTATQISSALPEAEWEDVLKEAKEVWPHGQAQQDTGSRERISAWRNRVEEVSI